MDEDEVPEEGRILYATPTLFNGIMALDTTKSREVINSFTVKRKVPQARFYTAIDLLDGKTTGEELGHYQKAATAKDINFMIVHKPALLKWDKHTAGDIIPPSINAERGEEMKINNITALDYSASEERLVLSLSGTGMEEVTGMDTSLVTIQTDAGDTVEVFAGYVLKSVIYDLTTSAYSAVLVRGAEDSTGKALDALTTQLSTVTVQTQEQATQLEDVMAALAELGEIVAGGTT